MRVILPHTEDGVRRNLRRERRRWDDEESFSLALGCVDCADLAICGGQNRRQDGMSCLDDCCGGEGNCRIMCPLNPVLFQDMFREIDEFGLERVPSVTAKLSVQLPVYVPLIYHRGSRPDLLDVEVAALPLHKLYDKRDGRIRFKDRAELRYAFGLAESTRVLLVGSGRDQPIENWWGLSTVRRDILNRLYDLQIEAITSPNYSLFTDVPRYDNLRNIKRNVIAWQEILSAGFAGGLHANARTVRDYNRLIEFIQSRDDVSDISFEFRTGAAWPTRRRFHAFHLARLAKLGGRPLNFIMVGGLAAVPLLASAFNRLVYVDTTAFMGAMHRQSLVEGNDGKISKIPLHTAPGEPISKLLNENILVMRRHVERRISESRGTR